ncbi:MAG: hypothetical protein ACE5G2_12815, partial [Candidatus Krumholzibacteriia bacterium]
APVGKGTRAAIGAFRSQLRDVREQIGAAQSAFQAGHLHTARERVDAATARALEILREIRDAKARVRALRDRGEEFE